MAHAVDPGRPVHNPDIVGFTTGAATGGSSMPSSCRRSVHIYSTSRFI